MSPQPGALTAVALGAGGARAQQRRGGEGGHEGLAGAVNHQHHGACRARGRDRGGAAQEWQRRQQQGQGKEETVPLQSLFPLPNRCCSHQPHGRAAAWQASTPHALPGHPPAQGPASRRPLKLRTRCGGLHHVLGPHQLAVGRGHLLAAHQAAVQRAARHAQRRGLQGVKRERRGAASGGWESAGHPCRAGAVVPAVLAAGRRAMLGSGRLAGRRRVPSASSSPLHTHSPAAPSHPPPLGMATRAPSVAGTCRARREARRRSRRQAPPQPPTQCPCRRRPRAAARRRRRPPRAAAWPPAPRRLPPRLPCRRPPEGWRSG